MALNSINMFTDTRLRVIFVLLGAPLFLGAQEPAASQAQLIEALLARIDKLEKRVSELETRTVTTQVTTPAVQETPVTQNVTHEHEPPTGGSFSTPNLRVSGFSDINFGATDQRGSKSGFSEGQFILHFSSALTSKVSYFGELSATARSDAGMGSPPAPGFNFEVERSIIRFDQSDKLKLSFGRYHTPINYWNTAFHHGQWLQTTVSRPEMAEVGGGFIPVHFVGGLMEGALPSGALNLNYSIGVGNGRGEVISRGGDFADINNNRAWLVNLFSRPSALYGLQFGGSVYRDLITPVGALAGTAFHEWIESAHVVWAKENPEVIAEFANVTHQQVGVSRPSNSQAWYVQTAYRLPSSARLWKPYYRFEYIHIPKSDPIFTGVPSLAGSVVGVRYDISGFAALKVEYRRQRRPDQLRLNGLFAQTSFTF